MASVLEFFRGENIFITGVTGFVGKVLLEKLLRSFPDLENVYVLIRPKKGKDPSIRIKEITDLPLFSILKQKHPENLKKIVPIQGDCAQLGLGLSLKDREEIEQKVSIVFHSAASVRFDDTLTYATFMNTRSMQELMFIVRKMKKLKAMVHVSTSYSNCDRQVVEEIIYPPHADWRKIISMAENIDEYTLNILTPKILGGLPNTYVFTKSLAENVIKDLGDNLPVVVIRPSIIISTLNDPFTGWIDNFNGPMGILAASGKGLLHVSYVNPNAVMDLIPVDIVVKAMCVAGWEKAKSGNFLEPSVYNATSGSMKKFTVQEYVNLLIKVVSEIPFSGMLWRPHGFLTNNRLCYFWLIVFFQLIPAIIMDNILKLTGKKPLLVKLQAQMYSASMSFYYFSSQTWLFKNDRLLWLRKQILPSDKGELNVDDVENNSLIEYIRKGTSGVRLYLMKESPDTIPQAKRNYKRMIWLDRIVRGLAWAVVFWYIYRSGVFQNAFYHHI